MTKKHSNTLYITTQGASLFTEGETVVVKIDREVAIRVPLHNLEGIVCFGRVFCTPQLMGRCADRNISISFLTERGRFLAKVVGPISGNVLLRREQYRRADDEGSSSDLARAFVGAKIANCRMVVKRALRDHAKGERIDRLKKAASNMGRCARSAMEAKTLDSIRGVEGDAARSYFEVFDCFITRDEQVFTFEKRSRRPPLNPVNALLSFLYTLLLHDVGSALEAVGLDPQVGYLHRDRPGRPGLALDMMEELRPLVADRVVLSLINRRQVNSGGFETHPTGGVYMDDKTRKRVLVGYQERKAEEIVHPFLNERTTIGMLAHLQASLLSRYLRKDIDGYPPYFWR